MLGVNDFLSGNIDSGDSSRSLWQGGHDDGCLPGPSIVKSGVIPSCIEGVNKDNRSSIVRSAAEYDNSSAQSSVHRTSNSSSPWTAMVSHVLPKVDNVILAVSLSRWDDIMGPQTIRIWLQEKTPESSSPEAAVRRQSLSSGICERSTDPAHSLPGTSLVPSDGDMYFSKWEDQNLTDSVDSTLMTAVKYVTNHTVNCLTVSSSFGTSNSSSHEKGTSFFAVPDFNLAFLSLLFQVKEEKSPVPYSFALIVSYEHYKYFLQLRELCLQWLRRIAFRFHISYVKNLSSLDVNIWKNLNSWILDLCNILIELKTSGLMEKAVMVHESILKLDSLGRALSSHLQTFGSSVVIGSTASEINEMISFLGLFLEGAEKLTSCLINPPRKYSFHMGLKLQGLLLDEFGGRDLASIELTSNPVPVTVIDLTMGNVPSAVKQTANFTNYLSNHDEIYRQEYRFLSKGSGTSGDHKLIMHEVRESGKLIDELIEELGLLPTKLWERYINLFLERINHLALTLLSMVGWLRRTSNTGGMINFPGDVKGGTTLHNYLKDTLKLEEADFLIVLSRAEKLKPGTYVHVMESNSQ